MGSAQGTRPTLSYLYLEHHAYGDLFNTNSTSGRPLVRRIWNSVRDQRNGHGGSEEAMANIVPESWRDRAFRAGEQDVSGQSAAEVLPAHDAETISSSKAQQRRGKLVNRVGYERYVACLDQLPETTSQRRTGGPQGKKETGGLAKARQWSQSGPGSTAF